MTALNSLCPTCLSNVEDGASISESMCSFLAEELRFTRPLDQRLVCRKCYKSIIELRRFCSQLRDVELYYEAQLKSPEVNKEHETIEEIDNTDVDYESVVETIEPVKLDPISIEVVPVEKFETASHGKPAKKRTCGICSSVFSSAAELRSHLQTHPITYINIPKRRKTLSCLDCNERFDEIKDLIAHQSAHASDKTTKSMRCFKCSRSFSTKEALRDHELIHTEVRMSQCAICDKKYLNESSLKAHMKMAHSG